MRYLVTWLLAAVFAGVVVFMQRPSPPDSVREEKLYTGVLVEAPGPDQVVMMKVYLALEASMPAPAGGSAPAGAGSAGGTGSAGGAGAGGASPMMMFGSLLQTSVDTSAGLEPLNPPSLFAPSLPIEVKPMPDSRAPAGDRVRSAMVASLTLGAEAAESRLKIVEGALSPESDLRDDIDIVRRVAHAEPGKGEEVVKLIVPEARQAFESRHGKIGRVFLARADLRDPVVRSMSEDGSLLFVFFVLLIVYFCGLLLTGLVVWIVLLVQAFSGQFVRQMPRSIERGERLGKHQILFVETIAAFFAAFLGVRVLSFALDRAKVSPDVHETVVLVAQWLVALTILWPVARGMPVREWRRYVGLWAPRGLAREIGAGLCGYAAWMLVYFVIAMLVVMVYYVVRQNQPPQSSRITEVLGSNNPLVLVLVFTLATLWAPLVEETIFRGTLYRYWRVRVGLGAAAVGSAALFAMAHGYAPVQLVLVGMLGLGFALIREWRGSIVPTMVAHGVHNFVVTTAMLVILGLSG